MPLINSIEVANFMNRERRTPFEPTWPHCVFPLLGLNSIVNVPNGRGKTTIVKLVLFILAGQKREIDKIRKNHFAPRSSGSYTHVRVQMIMDTEEGAGLDLLSGTPLGKQMVFGVCGRSGDNEEYKLYSYHGDLENCPVHRKDSGFSNRINLIPDKEFEEKLHTMPYKFPSTARESSADNWRTEVEKWFDLTSIEQQIAYQNKAGGEGKSNYFDVPGKDSEFASNVFYEHLAPELLHDVMGGHGEEDEKNIEDTIHEKTRQVIHARLRNADTAKSLEKTSRVLREMNLVCSMAEEMTESATRLQSCQSEIALELGALKDAVIDRPFPGLPAQPPAELADVAQFIVLCDGKPFLTDRGVGYFSGEEAKVINQRADRKEIPPSEIQNTQLIEITCDQIDHSRDDKGRSTRYYDLDSATSVISIMEKFSPEWDKDSAIAMLQKVFEWALLYADTNPARAAKVEHDAEYELKKDELESVNNELTALGNEKLALFKEQTDLAGHGAEYQRMQDSGLFTPEELAAPGTTGSLAKEAEQEAKHNLDSHNQQASRLETVYGHWKQFVEQHGSAATPESILATISLEESNAREKLNRLRVERNEISGISKSLKAATSALREKRSTLKSRITNAEKALVKAALYDTWFKGESPDGLEKAVRREWEKANEERHRLEKELSAFEVYLADIELFRTRFGRDVDPGKWLENRNRLHERLRERKGNALLGMRNRSTELEDLEKFSVAPGQFARDVQENVGTGVEFIPLHAAVDAMGLDGVKKRTLLTLFSALLFAPVLRDAVAAETVARNLAEKKLEFPVFVASDLEKFCRGEDFSISNNSVRSLFIGVKTQNVDCLLDPDLLEKRKANIRQLIAGVERTHRLVGKALARTSHTTESAKLAERARQSIVSRIEDSALQTKSVLEPLKTSLIALESRASAAAIDSIRAMIEYYQALKGQSIEELKAEMITAEEKLTTAEDAESSNESSLSSYNEAIELANDLVTETGIKKSKQEPILISISSFLADAEHGPKFMETATVVAAGLSRELTIISTKSSYRFEDAQRFVESGADRLNAIVSRLQEIEPLIPVLDARKLALVPKVNSLMELGLILAANIAKVDGIARKMIKLYRKYRVPDLPTVEITTHDLYKAGRFLRSCSTLQECIVRLINLENDIESVKESIEEASTKLKDSDLEYKRLLSRFHSQIDGAIDDESLKLEEHVILLLKQSKNNPASIRGILNAAQLNYNKDSAANEVAKQQLDVEWSGISNWLSEFTRRLPANLDLMKSRFAPKKDQDQNLISAGFIISAQVINHEDIEDVLRDIVRDIEDYEESRYLKNHSDVRKDTQSSFRNNIRNKFYRRVIINPSIKVFIPSISRVKTLLLDKEIASSGQSVAISLLWIVKMSDFVSERERARKTVSMSTLAKRKMLSIKSQFIFIDGAFSHLSDRSLIDDVLGEIANTRGRFQLIVTGHDREYKPNWKLFPTMLNGREVGDRFMFIEKGVPVEPGTVGSNYGALSMIRTHVISTEVTDGPTAH